MKDCRPRLSIFNFSAFSHEKTGPQAIWAGQTAEEWQKREMEGVADAQNRPGLAPLGYGIKPSFWQLNSDFKQFKAK